MHSMSNKLEELSLLDSNTLFEPLEVKNILTSNIHIDIPANTSQYRKMNYTKAGGDSPHSHPSQITSANHLDSYGLVESRNRDYRHSISNNLFNAASSFSSDKSSLGYPSYSGDETTLKPSNPEGGGFYGYSSARAIPMNRASLTSVTSPNFVNNVAYSLPVSQSYPAHILMHSSINDNLLRSNDSLSSSYIYTEDNQTPFSMSPTEANAYNIKREKNRQAAERCRRKKAELIQSLTSENHALRQENSELQKVNEILEQRVNYYINLLVSYGISLPESYK